MQLGNELRKARLAAGLTQEELAFKADISRNYVSLLELGEKSPTVQVLLRICKVAWSEGLGDFGSRRNAHKSPHSLPTEPIVPPYRMSGFLDGPIWSARL